MAKKSEAKALAGSDVVEQVFQRAVDLSASDVHLTVGHPVVFRINGDLFPQTEEPVTAQFLEQFARAVLGETVFGRFLAEREVGVSYQIPSAARFRVNCAFERDNVMLVARTIPESIPSLEELDLVAIAERFCNLQDGLILFTGPTGTGKSTTLAALIQHINASRAANIITLEDPIEFLFRPGKGVVRQRQYMHDFLSFAEALKRVLRQDPDIVMVGEMRDPETIAAALTLAETGHLTFATLHTPNTYQSIDRIIDVFPPHQQPQIRSQLSLSLRAVIAQRLIPNVQGGLVAQREVLINTPAVGNIIRESRLTELKSVLQTGGEEGMYSFERDAKRLYKAGIIAKDVYEFTIAGY